MLFSDYQRLPIQLTTTARKKLKMRKRLTTYTKDCSCGTVHGKMARCLQTWTFNTHPLCLFMLSSSLNLSLSFLSLSGFFNLSPEVFLSLSFSLALLLSVFRSHSPLFSHSFSLSLSLSLLSVTLYIDSASIPFFSTPFSVFHSQCHHISTGTILLWLGLINDVWAH